MLYDSAGGALGQRRAVLRLRSVNGGAGATLTYKGTPTQTNGVKAREEIEVAVTDAAAMQALLAALDYKPTTSYRKRRESWHLDTMEVSLDTLFIGYFCEIEGATYRDSGAGAAIRAVRRAGRAGRLCRAGQAAPTLALPRPDRGGNTPSPRHSGGAIGGLAPL